MYLTGSCLFVLMLNVPVNNFSVILGRSHRFLGITSTCLAQGHNTAEVGFENLTGMTEYVAT